MKIKDIQYLIDNKLQPNVAEWTMDVEDVLLEMDMLSDDTKCCNDKQKCVYCVFASKRICNA